MKDNRVAERLDAEQTGVVQQVDVCAQQDAIVNRLRLLAAIGIDVSRLKDFRNICSSDGTATSVRIEQLFAKDVLAVSLDAKSESLLLGNTFMLEALSVCSRQVC